MPNLQKVQLGCFPTPLHRWNPPDFNDFELWIKRDDLSGLSLSGNKIRKLEYLLQDAINSNSDCVVTIGTTQSNQVRAVACAARQLKLDSYVMLIADRPEDVTFTGNLLFLRMVGAKIYTVTNALYQSQGSTQLKLQMKQRLESQNKRPYVIPVCEIDDIGINGYMDAITEICDQCTESSSQIHTAINQQHSNPLPNHIVIACCTGGTIMGVVIAILKAKLKIKVHAVIVSNLVPSQLYINIESMARRLGHIDECISTQDFVTALHDILYTYEGSGLGYTKSSVEELK